MANKTPIFTNKALRKMKTWNLSETNVLDAFNRGEIMKSPVPSLKSVIKKYHDYEIGILYKRKQDGEYLIVSVWRRKRR